MYTPEHFQMTRAAALAFIDLHPFGQLMSTSGALPQITLLPFLRQEDLLLGHLAAANPHAQWLAGPATALFSGAHGYVSPRWYQSSGQVPTWNYQAVQVTGEVSLVTDSSQCMAIIDQLVAVAEANVAGNAWQANWAEPRMQTLLKHIVVFRMSLDQVNGKSKMSQNRSAADRAGAIQGLAASPHQGDQSLAAEMAAEMAAAQMAGSEPSETAR